MTPDERVFIDREKCIGCGECARVCPSDIIEMRDGKAVVAGRGSILCGHCSAICPAGAVAVQGIGERAEFSTFKADDAWLPHGGGDLRGLAWLMRSRRSCRNYLAEPAPREMLDDLIKLGVTAPSGTNSQKWTFTVFPDREAVLALGREVAKFFRDLNRKAEKPWLRKALRLAGKPRLDEYHSSYYPRVRDALRRWDEDGEDLLFHGAPAAIVVGSEPGASCPAEDALLASGQILLAAHAMGLGTCLIGYAVAAMKARGEIKKAVGVPASEDVHAVIALGYPNEKYQRPAGRKKPIVRYFGP